MATGRKLICEEENQGKYKKKMKTRKYLNEDILFNIFTRIPADILHNNFKYQCRQWRRLVSYQDFVNTNICHSKPGIIYMEHACSAFEGRYLLKYMELSRSEILRVCTLHEFKSHLTIKSSCNGLLLMREKDPSLYRIMNPLTKKQTTFLAMRSNYWCELVFNGEYKVVELFDLHEDRCGPHCLRITTLNGKPPKHIQVPVDYDGENKRCHVYISGVFYWTTDNHIVSFNLETEAFNILQMPAVCGRSWVDLINLYGSQSLVECRSDCRDGDVWSMEGGKWEKVFTLNDITVFVGFLDDANLFIYEDHLFKLGAYDVKKKQHCPMDDSKYLMNEKNWCFGHKVHVNSFLSLNHMV